GSDNVFLGYRAGFNERGSQKLYIANSDTVNPLIYGAFDSTLVRINGDLEVTGALRGIDLNPNMTFVNNNTFVGIDAGASNMSGFNNSFYGSGSGRDNTSGFFNSFYGSSSGQSNTTGSGNSFFGLNSGGDNTTGSSNSFFGLNSGQSNTTGADNSFFGQSSGAANRTGIDNSFYGTGSGFFNTTGSSNSFFGRSSGRPNRTGARNTYIGRGAGDSNQDGSDNVFLGYRAGFNERGSQKLYIANSDTVNPLIYGDFSSRKAAINGFLGVGIQDPERPLHLRDPRAILRIDRDRPDPGVAIVRYDQGFQQVWKSFYFYTLGTGLNQGKFIIADWGTEVSGPEHTPRLTIDNNGNIGIGARFENLNANGTAKLHVDGTVR
ncbi:MAG: hypothetical protein AAFU64_18315, partial [Bacteroidota bacterium]